MKIAVISDIHGNIYVLNEVLETLRKEKILTIMGNYDDAIGNFKKSM